MMNHTFIASPCRRLITLDYAADFAQAEETFGRLEEESCGGAIIRLRVPQSAADEVRGMTARLEAAGAFEVRVEIERAETIRRRDTQIAAGMTPDQALDEWLLGKPDLLPLREQLHEEAARVEEGMSNG